MIGMSTRRSAAAPSADPATPSGCTHFKLKQASRQVGRLYDARMAAAGLKTTQYSLLSHVIAMEPVRPSDLASAMQLDPSSLTRNLQPLIAAGWVEQGPGANARSRLVSATAEGRRKRADAQRTWKDTQRAMNERLGSERVARLHALLDECMSLIDQDGQGALDD